MMCLVRRIYISVLIGASLAVIPAKAVHNEAASINLAGTWHCRLDPNGCGEKEEWYNQTFQTAMQLPGSLDQNKLGRKVSVEPELTTDVLKHLTRKYCYIGPAWYQKQIDIPQQWKDKYILLSLERVLWDSQLWIDGKKIGTQDSLATPHIYDISAVGPGRHTLAIRVDNSYKYRIGSVRSVKVPFSHSYTEETQTVWNGIIGEMKITAYDKLYIEDVQIYPDADNKLVNLNIKLSNRTGKPAEGTLTLSAVGMGHQEESVPPKIIAFKMAESSQDIVVDYPMGDNIRFWSEFTPDMYELKLTLNSGSMEDSKTAVFGIRKLVSENGAFVLNGNRIFLRGTVECCVFPLTGYPAMDRIYWEKIFRTCREYGLNHMRFHSWCPPKAAFDVADSIGFYLQVELPVWVFDFGADAQREAFIRAEADRIISAYGNHPSFCMLSIGNELSGDFNQIEQLVMQLKKDTRRLYTTTTYSFQKGRGDWPSATDDYFISQCTRKGWIRGQGFFNTNEPSTTLNFNVSLEGINVPTISHEIGQYAVFPNMKEIDKYKGVLKPVNFEAVRKVLAEKHLLQQADVFTLASGKLAAILYKEDIELAMRSSQLDGFQMLSLTDFPGQGTALTGILDVFWDSKGILQPEQFRQFCQPTVPLLEMPKFIYQNNETFTARALISHFGPKTLANAQFKWSVKNESNKIIAHDSFDAQTIKSGGNSVLGNIKISLENVKKASKLRIEVFADGSEIRNGWDFWVYPAEDKITQSPNILIAKVFDSNVRKWLNEGKTVLLTPDHSSVKRAVSARFVPVFWSPVHFPEQPGTMGILCEPNHPALANFPTDFHTNWQWWELTKQSVAIDVDLLGQDIKPIVQPICNFLQIKKLAYIFEAKIGKGKLMFCSLDISNELDKRLVARQLRRSLLSYLNSNKFAPQNELSANAVEALFNTADEKN